MFCPKIRATVSTIRTSKINLNISLGHHQAMIVRRQPHRKASQLNERLRMMMTLIHFWSSIPQNQSVDDLLDMLVPLNSYLFSAHHSRYWRHSSETDSTTLQPRAQPRLPIHPLRRLLTAIDTNLLVHNRSPPIPRWLHPTAFLCAFTGLMYSIPPYSPVLLTASFTFNTAACIARHRNPTCYAIRTRVAENSCNNFILANQWDEQSK